MRAEVSVLRSSHPLEVGVLGLAFACEERAGSDLPDLFWFSPKPSEDGFLEVTEPAQGVV